MSFKYLLLIIIMTSFISAGIGVNFNEESDVIGVNFIDELTGNITNYYTTNNYTYNGSTLTLNDISDVNVPSPSNGQALIWNSSLSKWIASTIITVDTKWIVDNSNGYLYNDSDTIYFNETKLNNTIDSRAASIDNNFDIYINGSAYNNVVHNITKGDVNNIEYTIVPGDKFIFGDILT